jgi:hypothetical protein
MVRDAAGRFVPDLALAEFELFEDGIRQGVDSSYVVQGRSLKAPAAMTPSLSRPSPTDIQRVFVVVFDEAHMAAGSVVRAKQAALAFLSNDFTTGDIGGVVSKSRMAGGRLTNVRGDLEEAVKAVQPSDEMRSREATVRDWPRIVNLYEALRASTAPVRPDAIAANAARLGSVRPRTPESGTSGFRRNRFV